MPRTGDPEPSQLRECRAGILPVGEIHSRRLPQAVEQRTVALHDEHPIFGLAGARTALDLDQVTLWSGRGNNGLAQAAEPK